LTVDTGRCPDEGGDIIREAGALPDSGVRLDIEAGRERRTGPGSDSGSRDDIRRDRESRAGSGGDASGRPDIERRS
jgi:hypothetical protein